jgi:uncharacterized iron-regulated membrane protein
MADNPYRSKQALALRRFRKVHRITGIYAFVFLFLMGLTGVLLGLKKHSGTLIFSKSYSGSSTDLKEWLPLDSLYANACRFLRDSVSSSLSTELERVDVRPDKGMIKFIFVEKYWALQLDGATGALLHIERRRSDFIENLHDGSLVDKLLGISGGWFKLFYSTTLGLALILFTITGFWLWYGPRRMRNH